MRPAQLTASLTGDHRGSGAITLSPTCSRPPLLRTTEYRYIPEAQTNPKDSFASGGSAALMTQAASYASRKRPADSPLPIYSPAKLPRVTGYDNRSIVVSFVKGVFGATASPDLPVHSHPKSGNLPTISPRISRNPTPATKQVSMPPPKVLPIKTSSTSLAPISSSGSPVGPTTVSPFIARKEGRPPKCSTARDAQKLQPGDDQSRRTADAPSRSSSRRHSVSESNHKPVFERPPSSVSRPRSMINVTSMPNLDCEDEKPQKASKSITEASQWRARPVVPVVPSPSPSRSQSSVASTSKVTLDSASSWISNDSGTDRPSSATSATSTYSETPQSKPILLPEFFYRHSSLDSTPGADKRPTNAASVPSAASQGQSTHFLSQYEPKVDLNGRSMIYPTDSKPRVRPAEKRKRERVHIYYDKHKQSLVPRREAVRENLKRVAYLKSKSQGYKGTEEEHDQFVDYAALTLQAVEKPAQDTLEDWLGRAQDTSRKTIAGPPPPKPYIPELDKLLSYFRTRDAAIDERLHPPRPRLPKSLPEDDEKSVEATFRRPGVIAKIAREQVANADIVRLRPRQWLNDEIINFYGAMIMARAEEQKENAVPRGKILKAFYLSSFFWQKLSTDGYEKGRLAKWTKKVDIFSRDVVLIPVNHGNAHWTAAAINFQKKRFESYDSMGMAKEAVWKRLREYVRAEHLNKKKKPFDFTDWKDWAPDSTPQQDNGYDCGVFTCQFLESLSRGEDDFVFTQEDMPYLRRRMVWEIAHTQLRNV